MTTPTSSAEELVQAGFTGCDIVNGVIHGDPFTYWDGCTTALLRSGVDGPHAGLADRLCNINGRLHE
jgi:hypothetical protein